MKFLKDILYDFFPRGRKDHKTIYEKFNCYACMHVRYGINSEDASMHIKGPSDLRNNIREVVKKAYRWKRKSLPLYIMSNIIDSGYFDFLKPKYDIYRYTDFEELREQFTCREIIDNNLLYLVEKNIMRYAPFKILPDGRNQFIFTGPFKISPNGREKAIREKHRVDKG